MHHPLHVDPHVRILEPLDLPSASMAVREEGEGVAGDLVEDRVVVAAGEGHHRTR
jgi:hypothetical protein